MYTIGQDLIDSQPAVDAAAAELEVRARPAPHITSPCLRSTVLLRPQAWNWMWGETPEFTHTMRGAPAGLDVVRSVTRPKLPCRD